MTRCRGIVLPALAALCLLAACSAEDEAPGTSRAAEPPKPGLYQGIFPCGDCPGIDTTLWLRPDGTFFLGRTYLDEAGTDGERYHGLGRWTWQPAAALLTLRANGPEQVFDVEAGGILTLRTESELPHRLTRIGDLEPFTEPFLLQGEYRLADGVPVLRECRTGLVWQVVERGDYRRLRQQYGSVPLGSPALASVRGRLVPRDAGSVIVVEELIRLEPAACP